jgi:hypothetical protein
MMKLKIWTLFLICALCFADCKPTLPTYVPQTSILVEVYSKSNALLLEDYYKQYLVTEPKLVSNINYQGYLTFWDASTNQTTAVLKGDSGTDTFSFSHQARLKNLQGDEDILYWEYYDFKLLNSTVKDYTLEHAPADSVYQYKLTIYK